MTAIWIILGIGAGLIVCTLVLCFFQERAINRKYEKRLELLIEQQKNLMGAKREEEYIKLSDHEIAVYVKQAWQDMPEIRRLGDDNR